MKRKVAICALILCLLVYLLLAWPRPVNLDLKGTAYLQSDPEYTENVSIKIDGQINNPYFGMRGFTGQIYCEAIGLDGEYQNLVFDETNKSYLSVPRKNGNRIDFGDIFTSSRMDVLVITRGEKVLVFPSENRAAAKDVADRFFSAEYQYYSNNE